MKPPEIIASKLHRLADRLDPSNDIPARSLREAAQLIESQASEIEHLRAGIDATIDMCEDMLSGATVGSETYRPQGAEELRLLAKINVN